MFDSHHPDPIIQAFLDLDPDASLEEIEVLYENVRNLNGTAFLSAHAGRGWALVRRALRAAPLKFRRRKFLTPEEVVALGIQVSEQDLKSWVAVQRERVPAILWKYLGFFLLLISLPLILFGLWLI